MDNTFGTWVKRRRKALDLTQQELAQKVGCSVSAIFKIEADERRPSRQVAELLAAALSVPVEQRELFLKMARTRSPDSTIPTTGVAPVAATVSTALSLNELVGREHELQAIARQMADPTCRLLTLTGPGGVGKTRLALEAAHQLSGRFAMGAFFVSLVGVGAPEHMVPAIGDALGFTFSGQAQLKAQLFHFLKEKHVLLVLDNLEHLLAGVELLDELLEYAPNVKILATSREPLHLRAEWVFEVHELPIPTAFELHHLKENSAVALFAQRARQTSVTFTLAPEDADVVARVCRLVAGLPLALELAASWVRVMPLAEIAQQIEGDIDFLTTTMRDAHPRHRSMRAVFDHSWGLLAPTERRVMERLAVFRGGFTREAAAQVAGASLTEILSLVDKSLVRRAGQRRYDLHELTRQYSAARLEEQPAEARAARARHAAYYLSLLGSSEYALRSARQQAVFAELKPEIDNIRAAWTFAVSTEDFDLLQQTAGALYYFYELHQFFQEAEGLYQRAAERIEARLAAAGKGLPTAERSRLLVALAAVEVRRAFFLQRMSRNSEAIALYQINLKRLQSLDEPFLMAHTLVFYGIVTWAVGDYDTARRSFDAGLPLSSQHEYPWLYLIALCFLAALQHDLGDYEGAYEHFRQAMALCQQTGDPYITLLVGVLYSRTAQASGRLVEAQDLLEVSLRIARETNNRWGIGIGLEQLAAVMLQRGETARARQMLEESVALHREVGDRWSLSRALDALGRLALEQQDLTAAERSALEGARIAAGERYYPNALDALATLAFVYARRGEAFTALELALFVYNHSSSSQEARMRVTALRQELEAQLTPAQVEEAAARARATVLDAWFTPGTDTGLKTG